MNYRNNISAISNMSRFIIENTYDDTGTKKRYKNWIYVTYEDDDGDVYEGWINNIYVNRIEKSK
jgi:hypothetical protein